MRKKIENEIKKSVRKNTKRIEEFVANNFANGGIKTYVVYKQEVEKFTSEYPEFADYIKEHYTKQYSTIAKNVAIKYRAKISHNQYLKEIRFERG